MVDKIDAIFDAIESDFIVLDFEFDDDGFFIAIDKETAKKFLKFLNKYKEHVKKKDSVDVLVVDKEEYFKKADMFVNVPLLKLDDEYMYF